MTIPELLARIPLLLDKRRAPPIEGWCTLEKAYDLVASVLTLRPEVTVEIGGFGGASALPIAIALSAVGKGQLIVIDPWDAKESAKGQTGENFEWWSKLDHETIYKGFMNAVLSENVAGQVVVLRQTSDTVKAPAVIDFFHSDGNHGEQAIRDVKRFCPNIRVGGLCFLDDIGWAGGAVGEAATWMLSVGFVKIYDRDTGAMFQRVGPHPMPQLASAAAKRRAGRPAGKNTIFGLSGKRTKR